MKGVKGVKGRVSPGHAAEPRQRSYPPQEPPPTGHSKYSQRSYLPQETTPCWR